MTKTAEYLAILRPELEVLGLIVHNGHVYSTTKIETCYS